jgi:hypothetical protein
VRKCEFCGQEATHHEAGDWFLCDPCFRKRLHGRVVAWAIAVIVAMVLLHTWQACVVQPAS